MTCCGRRIICLCCLSSRISDVLFTLAAWIGDLSDALGTVAEKVADWGSKRC